MLSSDNLYEFLNKYFINLVSEAVNPFGSLFETIRFSPLTSSFLSLSPIILR